jgi:hypothetical protein
VWTARTDSYGRNGGIMVNPDFTSVGNLTADPQFGRTGGLPLRSGPARRCSRRGDAPPPQPPQPAPNHGPWPAPGEPGPRPSRARRGHSARGHRTAPAGCSPDAGMWRRRATKGASTSSTLCHRDTWTTAATPGRPYRSRGRPQRMSQILESERRGPRRAGKPPLAPPATPA